MMRLTSDCTAARCSVPRGFDFDGCGKVGVLDLLVAFEGDAIEHRRFGDVHDKPLAGAVDRNLVEQARCDQRFQRRIARGFVELPVGAGVKIGAHGFGIDAAIAFDDDRSCSGRCCRFGRNGVAKINPERRGQQAACGTQPMRSQDLRDAFDPHVLPDSHLTACDRIARAGRKNVWT